MKSFLTYTNRIYSRDDFKMLFLICSLPFHFWTLFLSLRDVSWLVERTNLWDALGVISYGLIFAFIESAIVFVLFVVIGLLTPAQWTGKMRITVLGIFELFLGFLAILTQVSFIWGESVLNWLGYALSNTEHPLRFLYGASLIIVLSVLVFIIFSILRYKKFSNLIYSSFENLSLLAGFYLVLDMMALIIILFRNL